MRCEHCGSSVHKLNKYRYQCDKCFRVGEFSVGEKQTTLGGQDEDNAQDGM